MSISIIFGTIVPVCRNRFVGCKMLQPFVKISDQSRYLGAFTYKKEGSYYTILPEKHSSGVLSSLAGKNSLFLIPEGAGPYKKGDRITVELINHLEEEL